MRIENESERQRLREMLVELEPALESVDHDTANGNDPSGGDPPRTRGDANSGNVG